LNNTPPPPLAKKLSALRNWFANKKSLIVALSGGVDSSLLLAVGAEILAEQIWAVTVNTIFVPESELLMAKKIANSLGVKHKQLKLDILNITEVTNNSKERCYYCKKEILKHISNFATTINTQCIIEGSNLDDTTDWRPGSKAITESGVLSPLQICNFTKKDIRYLATNQYQLSNAQKPSYACLATRIPYNHHICKNTISRLEKLEQELQTILSSPQLRARVYDDSIRLEISPNHLPQAIQQRKKIISIANKHNFNHIALDLQGYKQGKMNTNH